MAVMNDKDRLDSYTPEERQALRHMLRDPSTVKDLFNQQRITFKCVRADKSVEGPNPYTGESGKRRGGCEIQSGPE